MEETAAKKRTDEDLDSIELGTPSKGGFKLYYDSRRDSYEEVCQRVQKAVKCIGFAQEEMQNLYGGR